MLDTAEKNIPVKDALLHVAEMILKVRHVDIRV